MSAIEPVIIVLYLGLAFVLYWKAILSDFVEGWLSTEFDERKIQILSIELTRLIGFIFFGLIPFIVFFVILGRQFHHYGLFFGRLTSSVVWIGILSCIIILLNIFFCKKESILSNYPQIRIRLWSVGNILSSAITWILYLLAYEFLFRGLLFFSLEKSFGLITAVIVNVIVYFLVHLPKGISEALGSLPLGILLCIAVYHTGHFYVAFVVHSVLALSNEWLSLYYNPKMTVKFRTI